VKGNQYDNRGYVFNDRHLYRIASLSIGKEAIKVKRQAEKSGTAWFRNVDRG